MSNPFQIQMDWALARKKPFFVGHRTLQELEKQPLDRVLVGFEIEDIQQPIPLESHLVLDGEGMIGRVTSCIASPTLNSIIGLAYVDAGYAELGRSLTIKVEGGARVSAKVVPTPFYDPKNRRQVMES